MDNIDYERLREDLINYLEGGFFIGGFWVACDDIEKLRGTDDELVILAIAVKYHFSLILLF